MKNDLTFLSLMRANNIPPRRDNTERLRLMRARLTPTVGNGEFNFAWGSRFKWEGNSGIKVLLSGVKR